jgi:hypothetical protein
MPRFGWVVRTIRLLAGTVAAVAVVFGGCATTGRGASGATAPSGAAVAISMRPPRELVELSCGDQVREYRRVLGLAGRVSRTSGDTLDVSVTSLQIEGASQAIDVRRGCLTSVVRDQFTSVTVLSQHPGRVEIGLGIGLLAYVVTTLVVTWAVTRGN